MPSGYHHHQPAPAKADTKKLVSMLLKAIIMTLITTLFFLLIGLASLLLLPLILISLHRHHHRRPRPRHKPGLSPRDVKRLPKFRFSEPQRHQPQYNECVVCLEGFRQGQWCRRLVGCGHVFHTKCVDTWLLKVAACPTCRTPLLLPSQ